MPSIAVLLFTNMSADPKQEYFCEGMAEELIDALARLEGLRVVARTSAFQFKDRPTIGPREDADNEGPHQPPRGSAGSPQVWPRF